MTDEAASRLKERMRTDLRQAMKAGRSGEIRLIRSLIAAIDNAEAPSQTGRPADAHDFLAGTAEVTRLSLRQDEVQSILLAEVQDREAAAREMSRLGQQDRAAELSSEVPLIARYLA